MILKLHGPSDVPKQRSWSYVIGVHNGPGESCVWHQRQRLICLGRDSLRAFVLMTNALDLKAFFNVHDLHGASKEKKPVNIHSFDLCWSTRVSSADVQICSQARLPHMAFLPLAPDPPFGSAGGPTVSGRFGSRSDRMRLSGWLVSSSVER